MSTIGSRITELRKKKNWSQSELAKAIDISYPQMSRYEIKGVQPPADVIKRLADILATSTDYLINGTAQQKATETLKDINLLQHFKAVEKLDDDDKSVVLKLIDAFITKRELKKLAS